jgi:hypothetical protein
LPGPENGAQRATGPPGSQATDIWPTSANAPTQKEAESFAGGLSSADNVFDDFGFVGTPQQLVEQMRPFIELGVDYFKLDCSGFPKLTTLGLLINEVLPAVNG